MSSGLRIRHFDLGAQHVEPCGAAGIEARLRQPLLSLGAPQALLGHRDALLLQQRAVVGLDHLQRQRLPRTLELMLRRGRLRLRGGQAVLQPAAGVDRLRHVEPEHVLAGEIRAKQLLVVAEDARRNPQRRGLLGRREQVARVSRGQEGRARFRHARIRLAHSGFRRLQRLVAFQRALQRVFERQRAARRLVAGAVVAAEPGVWAYALVTASTPPTSARSSSTVVTRTALAIAGVGDLRQ